MVSYLACTESQIKELDRDLYIEGQNVDSDRPGSLCDLRLEAPRRRTSTPQILRRLADVTRSGHRGWPSSPITQGNTDHPIAIQHPTIPHDIYLLLLLIWIPAGSCHMNHLHRPFRYVHLGNYMPFSVASAGRTLPRRHTSVERKLGDLGLGRVGSLCIAFDGLYHRELSSTWLLSTLCCGADKESSLCVDSQSIPCKREFGQS